MSSLEGVGELDGAGYRYVQRGGRLGEPSAQAIAMCCAAAG
jgi:hypothetical protein